MATRPRTRYAVQELRFTKAPANERYAREVRHALVGRVWRTIAICDRLSTAESVARNARISSDTLLRIHRVTS